MNTLQLPHIPEIWIPVGGMLDSLSSMELPPEYNNNHNTTTLPPIHHKTGGIGGVGVGSLGVFHSNSPTLPIQDYIFRLYKYSKASEECYIYLLVLVDRWIRTTNQPLTRHNVHRISLGAFLLSIKAHDDLFYSDKYYAKVGGVTPKELTGIEMQFLKDVKYCLWVQPDTFLRYHRACYAKIATSTTTILHSTPSKIVVNKAAEPWTSEKPKKKMDEVVGGEGQDGGWLESIVAT